MSQNKNITSVIKYLFSDINNIIKNNPFQFINLVATHSLLLLLFTILNNWIIENIDFYSPILGIITLRIAISMIITGLWIGFFKIIFQFINKNNFSIKPLLSSFHLLPKVITIQSFYYIAMCPILILFINRYPYDIKEFGTDISGYFLSIIKDFESFNIINNTSELLLIIFFLILPITYMLKFWSAEFLIIEEEISIINAMKKSYMINIRSLELISISVILFILNLISIIFGYFIFVIILTYSYLVILKYLKVIQKINH
tara:strand:+ start:206 stop:982 length:777 start_codon:yes stop_codon:yes gene_type:complete